LFKWLETALDYGITENDFWNMTIAEAQRAIDSKIRVRKIQAQEKATYDYILADLIGRSVSRIYSSSGKLPELYEVYPSIFNAEDVQEQKEKQVAELSILRFKQYANFHNKKFNKEVAITNE
jgi:hypothetical protein